MERRETSSRNEVLVLRCDRGKVSLCCRVDAGRFGIIEYIAQTEALEYFYRVAR